MQHLEKFKLPPKFRGKNFLICQIWWIVQSLLFSTSPQFMYGWRNFLLRLFGAKIGRNVIIRPSVRITFPWKLSIGNHSWIGDHVDLYTLGEILIGENAVISQRSYLCTGSHDFTMTDFSIFTKPIIIEDCVWVATDVFISPGVCIGRGAVIGARSSVFKDMPPMMICVGNPARPVRKRISTESQPVAGS